jgi:hypothetical protein
MDRRLALEGPPSIFILDHEQKWRFDASLTRDGTQRLDQSVSGSQADLDWAFVLLRDRATGFVSRMMTTGRGLFEGHTRADPRFFATEDEFNTAWEEIRELPVVNADWLEG